jgi:hypothetical protein
MNGFDIDHDTVDGLRRLLRAGHDLLEGLDTGAPTALDAGAVSDVLGEALAHLVRAAGEFSTGLAITDDAVHDGQREYLGSEVAAADWFSCTL